MSTAPHTRPATWEEYLAIEGSPGRTEYIDGQIVMSPLPSIPHQRVCLRLVQALMAVVPPTHEVIIGAAWKPNANEFGPDVMVFPRTNETVRFTGVPALAVEVLSSTDLTTWSGSSTATPRPACRTTGSSTCATANSSPTNSSMAPTLCAPASRTRSQATSPSGSPPCGSIFTTC